MTDDQATKFCLSGLSKFGKNIELRAPLRKRACYLWTPELMDWVPVDTFLIRTRISSNMVSYLPNESLELLNTTIAQSWFYGIDLFGTAAFAVSGIIRAYKKHYDFFGCFVLAALPAVGGGTLRDVLLGGHRSPPFIFKDPYYLLIVAAIVVIAVLAGKLFKPERNNNNLNHFLEVSDAVGVAAFTVIGVKVALFAGLHWIWPPLLAAMTCAGGGILRDILSDQEPNVLKGEIYEEVAIAWGIVLMLLLKFIPQSPVLMILTVLVVMLGAFLTRLIVHFKNILMPRL